MSAQAADIRAAQLRLQEAGQELRRLPAAERIAALQQLLDALADPLGAFQSACTEQLASHAGFHPETIRAGLRLALEDWNGSALAALIENEVGDPANLDSRAASPLSAFPLTGCILAGSIPMPTLQALLLPLLLGSPVLVKPAGRDRVTPKLFARSLAKFHPLLARCIEICDFASDDAPAIDAFVQLPCLVASGSDATLERIRERTPSGQRFVGHGHRLSLAIVGADVEAEDWAERAARDVALWDQLGCLSTAAVYAVGDRSRVEAVARALAEALRSLEARWPRGRIGAGVEAAIRDARDEARFRAAAGQEVALMAPDDDAFTVVLEPASDWRSTPLHRFVRVYRVATPDEARVALLPLGSHLAAVSVDGVAIDTAGDSPDFEAKLRAAGASRVVVAGGMQAPPFGWHPDGGPLLAGLSPRGLRGTRA
ncbi:MAG: acyl-CoA reductase [Myxococcota bacterium]